MGWISPWVISSGLIAFSYTLFRLVSKWIDLNSFAKRIPRGSTELPDEALFDGGELMQLARDFFAEMRTFSNANILKQFDIPRQMEGTAIYLRFFSASARAMAGILILAALLVTLFNLQNAVSNLSDTFGKIADSSRIAASSDVNPSQRLDPVSDVQESMSRVAQAASEAFRLSALAIFLALVLLSLSWLSQRHANQTFSRLNSWAWRIYNAQIAKAALKTAGDDQADFSQAIFEFRGVVSAFEELSKDLTAIAGFREEMKSATTSIRDAVERLPATINTSMDSVSNNVAREIGNKLDKHLEILMQVKAMYGDQELRAKELQVFTKAVLQQHKSSAEALAALQALPRVIESLSGSIGAHASDTSRLTLITGLLDEKVSKLPVAEIGQAVRELQTAGAGLASLVEDSQGIQKQWNAFLNGWHDALKAGHRDVIGDIAGRLSQISSRLDALRALDTIGTTITGGFEKQSQAVRAVETSIAGATSELARLRDKTGTPAQKGEITEILAKLEELDKDVNKTVWQRLRGK